MVYWCSDGSKTGHGNLGEVLGPSGVACKGTKALQEELGSSLSVGELAEGDHVDVAIPS